MVADRVNAGRDRGFTMIEVMIAILLCAICVIGLIALFRVETASSASSRRTTEAVVLAQDRLEELRTLTPPLGTTTETLLDAGGAAGTGAYTRTTVVTGSTALYAIDITVSWVEDGTTRSVVVKGQRGGAQ